MFEVDDNGERHTGIVWPAQDGSGDDGRPGIEVLVHAVGATCRHMLLPRNSSGRPARGCDRASFPTILDFPAVLKPTVAEAEGLLGVSALRRIEEANDGHARIPFGTTNWDDVLGTLHRGETGMARWRTREASGIWVRVFAYSPVYLAHH